MYWIVNFGMSSEQAAQPHRLGMGRVSRIKADPAAGSSHQLARGPRGRSALDTLTFVTLLQYARYSTFMVSRIPTCWEKLSARYLTCLAFHSGHERRKFAEFAYGISDSRAKIGIPTYCYADPGIYRS